MSDSSSQFLPVDLAQASQQLYDAIIVGAGPAGSSSAFHLSSRGVRVLLLDRASFPRDKACGDAIMPPALAELDSMGLAQTIATRYQQVHSIRLVQGRNERIHSIQPDHGFSFGVIAPRAEFDTLLCAHALQQPTCDWLDRVVVHRIEPEGEACLVGGVRTGSNGSRTTEEVRLRARVVLIANGSRSSLVVHLRKELQRIEAGPALSKAAESDFEQFVAKRAYWSHIPPYSAEGALEFFFGIPGLFYFWVFPVHQDLHNVGAMVSKAQLPSHPLRESLLEEVLKQVLGPRDVDAQQESPWSTAPIQAGLRDTAFYNKGTCLVTGDAAALVDPQSGEGISGALRSGRWAAEQALARLQFLDASFAPYGQRIRDHFAARFEDGMRFVRLQLAAHDNG